MMEQNQDLDQLTVDSDTEKVKANVGLHTVGSALREARELNGMSVSEVAGRIKFSPRQIEALEEGDAAQLRGMTFIRGFVRSYARLLQLDEEPLLAALPGSAVQISGHGSRDVSAPLPSVNSNQKNNILWLVAALLVALALGMFVWLYDGGQLQPKVNDLTVDVPLPVSAVPDVLAASAPMPIVPTEPAPEVANTVTVPKMVNKVPEPKVPESTATPVAKPKIKLVGPPAELRLVFDEDSWVEVKDANDTVLLSQLALSGSERNLNHVPPYFVVIGNAKGVRVYYKGNQVDLVPHTRVDVAHLTLE